MDQPAYTPRCCGQDAKWVHPMINLAYFYCEVCKKEVSTSKPIGDDDDERLKTLLNEINMGVTLSSINAAPGGLNAVAPLPDVFSKGDRVLDMATGYRGTVFAVHPGDLYEVDFDSMIMTQTIAGYRLTLLNKSKATPPPMPTSPRTTSFKVGDTVYYRQAGNSGALGRLAKVLVDLGYQYALSPERLYSVQLAINGLTLTALESELEMATT